MVFGVFFSIIGVIACVIWGIDAYMAFYTWSSRIKVGRYKTVLEWLAKSEKVVTRWLKRTPTVKKKDNNRYIVLDMIKGEYRSSTIQSWQEAGLLMGIDHKDIQYKALEKHIDLKAGCWRNIPQEIDSAMLAFQLLKNSKNPSEIKPAMDEMVRLIESRCEDGYIWYRTYAKKNLYVDTIGLVCPFLVLYGKTYDAPQYIELGLNQILTYKDKGMLENYMIPCHAYDIEREIPLGIYGWGRGLGWFLLGVIESYLCLKEKERSEWLCELTKELAETILEFQQEDGGLGSNLAIKTSYDSSITAIAGYYLANCYKEFDEKRYKEGAQKCMKKLMSVTKRTGVLDLCQGDTKGLGLYSSHYDIMPFAQGIALAVGNIIEREWKKNEFKI